MQPGKGRREGPGDFLRVTLPLKVTWLFSAYFPSPLPSSIITFVAPYYPCFSKMKALAVEGKRIGKVLSTAGQ